MATTLDSASSDREEGEIIDEFEDISDNSIILPLSGKCDPSKDRLPVISLSSVSEDEEFDKHHQHHPHHHHHHRVHGHHHHHGKMFKKRKMKMMKMKMKRKFQHRKGLCSDSHSSDSNNDFIKLDSKLLKAAIRVNEHECLKNSLRSRLKGMTNLNNGLPSDNQNEVPKFSDPKVDQEVTSDEGDDELIQLRLEALRTAVLNKFQRRKKRKVKEMNDDDNLSENFLKTDDKENNKNPSSNIENIPKKPCIDIPEKEKIETNVESNSPLEDDEDVLRALLLASISKKITNEPMKDVEKLTVKTTIPLSNNNPNSNRPITLVNESNTKLVHNGIKHNMILNNKIHKIKSVRMTSHPIKHTKVKPIIININEDSDSDDDLKNKTLKTDATKLDVIESTVEKFLKEQRAKVEAQEAPIKRKSNVNNSQIFNKSAVKLLPKFKQIEYQNLLRQLKEKGAQKPRIKRNSHKSNGETKQIVNNSEKLIDKSNELKLNIELNDVKLNNSLDIAEDARALHKAFKEMQAPTNGRLQMQVQYKVLTPIVKKIDEASAERKKYNKEVKRLLEELTEAKKKLKDTHVNFKKYVNELLARKEAIDKNRSENPKSKEVPVTSTPLKDKNSFQSFNASSISENSDFSSKSVQKPLSNIKDDEKIEENEINPGDPNDIDKIYKRETCTIPRYISPLDNVNRTNIDDPFSVMCPYDIDGNCRDPDCAFQHYPT